MLETIEGMVMCGVVNYNDTWCEIYCDSFGSLVFDNYTDGMWYFTEINIHKPLPLDSVRDLISNIENGVYGECIGVVYALDGSIIVLLDDNQAVLRHVWSLTENEGEPFFYSTDEEFEIE